MKLLVTGGAGFIGSHFIQYILQSRDIDLLINLDKLTYAGHLENLKPLLKDSRYRFVRGDINSFPLVRRLMGQVDAVVNFAAETHVDRSIQNAAPFLQSNVMGVQVLLQAVRETKMPRFLHISTDEVYGSIAKGWTDEKANLNPSSPYAASKAAADLLVLSYRTTFGLPVLITRAANNYGPFQYPEKFLPLFITRALEEQPLPLYGDGKNVRDWLHVEDHCRGIETVLRKGKLGEVYNIGTHEGITNIEVVHRLLKRLGKPRELIRLVPDRLGHDRRYAMNIRKIERELGWRPRIGFEKGLEELVSWYLANRPWWTEILHRSSGYKKYMAAQYRQRLAKSKSSDKRQAE